MITSWERPVETNSVKTAEVEEESLTLLRSKSRRDHYLRLQLSRTNFHAVTHWKIPLSDHSENFSPCGESHPRFEPRHTERKQTRGFRNCHQPP